MLIYLRERERESRVQAGEGDREREREGDTESKAGSRLRAVSKESDVGLQPMGCEIRT